MRFYISGALMGSRDLEGARRRYEMAADVVARTGHEAYLPHQNSDPERAATMSPRAVFQTDLQALNNSAGMIAFLTEASLGVGAELAICAETGTPTLGLGHAAAPISRFAIGCLLEGGGRFERYSSETQLAAYIEDFIQDLSRHAEGQLPRMRPTVSR